jgi:CubicO group peptidase (beta-lactamase class C family)
VKRVVRLAAGLVVAGLVAMTSLALPSRVTAPAPDPGRPWFARPDLTFADVAATGEDMPQLYSLLVNWRGQMLFERYFNGMRAGSLANLKSASKSVLAVLIGIAIDRGLLPGIDTPITKYFPDIAEPEKQKITIENLLSMRSGLETTSNRNYGAWVGSPNWVRHILTRPMDAQPGERMIYSTGNTHLLSAILTAAAGESTWQFAQESLAQPLGFDLPRWSTDPQGIYFGGNDMLMTPRQMMAIGQVYLQNGRAGERQIVPQAWVEASCQGLTRSPRSRERYGYGWWIREFDSFETCYAWGYGGQYIFVIPELDLVIVATSSPNDSEDRRGHRGRLFRIVEDQIVSRIADAGEWDRLYSGDRSE